MIDNRMRAPNRSPADSEMDGGRDIPAAASRGCIFVWHHDPSQVDRFKRLLQEAGYAVATSKSIGEFANALAGQRPDLALVESEASWSDAMQSADASQHVPVIQLPASLAPGAAANLSEEAGLLDRIDLTLRLKRAEDALRSKEAALKSMIQQSVERTSAEDGLRESEQRYRILFDSNPHPMWVYDLESLRFLAVNDAAIEHYGYSRDEFLALTIADIRPPDDVPNLLRSVEEVKAGRTETKLDKAGTWRHLTKAGALIFVEITSHAIEFDGRPAELVLAFDVTRRLELENERRQSDERFRDIAENIREVFWLSAPDKSRIIYVSPGYEKVWGRSCAELYANPKSWLDSIHPDDRERIQTVALEQAKLETYDETYRVVRADGTTRWVRDRAFPVRDATDAISRIAGIAEDVTDQYEARQATEHREEYWRTLIENTSELISILDANGCVCYQGDTIQPVLNRLPLDKMLGYQPGELRGRAFSELIHPDDRARVTEAWRAIVKSPATAVSFVRLRIQHKNGTWRVFESAVRNLLGNPTVRAVVVHSRDITDREESEAALRHERNLLRTLIQALPENVYIKDIDGRFMLVNHAQIQVCGKTTEQEVIGKTVFDLWAPSTAQQLYEQDMLVLRQGESVIDAELPLKLPDGTDRWYRITKVPLRDPGGKIVGLVGLSRDITEHRKLEAQVLQGQKLDSVGRLAAGVAHDFNNLLTVISGHTELLATTIDDSGILQSLNEIKSAATRAAKLTQQLLAFGRKTPMQPRALDLNTVVLDMMTMFRRVLGEDITIQCRTSRGDALVIADLSMMEQVIMNLAVNARDAMPRGGDLLIATDVVTIGPEQPGQHPDARPGRFVRLVVQDTGSGIAPEILPRIFEPFFTTKDVGKGTGLGLATVYGIARQHQGWIEVDSTVGLGTSFRLFLPNVNTTEGPEWTGGRASDIPRGSGRILLVEDEECVHELAKIVLGKCGYKVVCARSGVEAIKVWQQHGGKFDLLLTDLVMPEGLSGCDIAARFRDERPELRVLYSSGYSSTMPELPAGSWFLPKPYGVEDLAHAVRRCLEYHSEAQDASGSSGA